MSAIKARLRQAMPRLAAIAFLTAATLGTLHAASSIYWAFGGNWLLETVGQWAVEAAQDRSFWVFAGLLATGVLKLAVAWIPLLAQTGLLAGRRFWRLLGWFAGPALALYGGANAIAGTSVLVGWIDSDVTDHDGMIGHAFIWGPLFALCSLALTTALLLSRPGWSAVVWGYATVSTRAQATLGQVSPSARHKPAIFETATFLGGQVAETSLFVRGVRPATGRRRRLSATQPLTLHSESERPL